MRVLRIIVMHKWYKEMAKTVMQIPDMMNKEVTEIKQMKEKKW
jgi:hypothetical protein